MMLNRLIVLVILGISLFTSCKKDEQIVEPDPEVTTGTVEIRFNPTVNGSTFQMNQEFIGPNNLKMRYEAFKFYLSQIQLSNGSSILGTKDVALIDFSLSNNSFTFEANEGIINQIHFGVGLTKELNGTNNPNFTPSIYPIDNPLSIYKGMYWTWASGYIFSLIEGRIDTSAAQNQNPDYSFFYHAGLDTLYSSYSIAGFNAQIVKGQKTTIDLKIELNDVLRNDTDTINMRQNYFTHTSDNFDLAKEVITNLGNAIRKQ
jgi:hypothetical protein